MAECRLEGVRVYRLTGNRTVRVILRNALVVEDPYLVIARAKALSVRTGEAIDVNRTPRVIKDHLIKTNISI